LKLINKIYEAFLLSINLFRKSYKINIELNSNAEPHRFYEAPAPGMNNNADSATAQAPSPTVFKWLK
jgi:hypothetical protein